MTPETAERNASDPPIRTRLFWTWDHSTEWALNRSGAQLPAPRHGCAVPGRRGSPVLHRVGYLPAGRVTAGRRGTAMDLACKLLGIRRGAGCARNPRGQTSAVSGQEESL